MRPHLLVLLSLIVGKNRFDLGVAVLPQGSQLSPAILGGQRIVVHHSAHLLLPVCENRQKLILLIGREIQSLGQVF